MSGPEDRRRIVVEEIGSVTVVTFIDTSIVDLDDIAIVGDQLHRVVDDQGRNRLLLNFGNVERLASSFFAKLWNLKKKVDAASGKVVLCKVSERILEGFRIVSFDKYFDIRETEPDGLQLFEA